MAVLDSQRYPQKLCLIKSELDINVYNFKHWLFLIGIRTKSDLRIFTAVKGLEIIRVKHFST